ncbi:hypothetical protein LZC95_48565 [Pendulispora brunnea]|uniref:Uncharacterized protein n=1 Tax=Pendulispora brunnea TaxID=2905690 RepID=A0ABZ2K6G9_9BACT
MMRFVLGASLCVFTLGAIASLSPKAEASPIQVSNAPDEDFEARDCTRVRYWFLQEAVINIWTCDIATYHAQIAHAQAGDQVWFGGDEVRYSVPVGSTYANTHEVETDRQVCARIAATGASDCNPR